MRPFRRIRCCKKCDKLFEATGRGDKVCEPCYQKAVRKGSKKRKEINWLVARINKMVKEQNIASDKPTVSSYSQYRGTHG